MSSADREQHDEPRRQATTLPIAPPAEQPCRPFSGWLAVSLMLSTGCVGVLGGDPLGPDLEPSADGGPRIDAWVPPSERDGGEPDPEVDAFVPVEEVDAFVPIDAGPPGDPLAEGVTLDGLAVFQGVRVGIADDGAPLESRNAPIVALRRAIVRAYVTPDAPRDVLAELEIREGDEVIAVHRDEQRIERASRDDDPGSVLQFDVPAEQITEAASLRVRLLDPDAPGVQDGEAHPARLPRDGATMPLGARDDGAGLELVLVPVRWTSDGTNRLPVTSDAWIDSVRALLTSMLPLVDVDITVREPISFDVPLNQSGNVSFGDLNSRLRQLRESDGASRRAYYYGLVRPTETFNQYCTGSCTTGQSFVPRDANQASLRVGSGVGFGTGGSAGTLAHELGHAEGRPHTPCGGPANPDPNYPHDGGMVGVWGFDPRTSTFLDPDETSDFMGYCGDEWTSDYTWRLIFERTIAVSALAQGSTREVLLVRVGSEVGAVLDGRARMLPPESDLFVPYRYLDARGRSLARGDAPTVEQSHTDERLVVIPAPPEGATRIAIAGRTLAL